MYLKEKKFAFTSLLIGHFIASLATYTKKLIELDKIIAKVQILNSLKLLISNIKIKNALCLRTPVILA